MNKRFVLSAAHCLYLMGQKLDTKMLKVVVGTVSRKLGTQYNVEEFISHEKFDLNTLRNDIMLAKVGEDIQFNDQVQPISIHKSKVNPGVSVTASGWGQSNAQKSIGDHLQFVTKETIGFRECRSLLPAHDKAFLFKEIMCTNAEENRGACPGDSGGPLVLNNELVGIVSWGYDCGLKIPNMYTKVGAYLKWIEEKMKPQKPEEKQPENCVCT